MIIVQNSVSKLFVLSANFVLEKPPREEGFRGGKSALFGHRLNPTRWY